MNRQLNQNSFSIQKALAAEERGRLNFELRQRYLERLEKDRAAREYKRAAEDRLAEERMKQEARHRFMLANPYASEADFHGCWLTIRAEMDRQRAQKTLEDMKKKFIRPSDKPVG